MFAKQNKSLIIFLVLPAGMGVCVCVRVNHLMSEYVFLQGYWVLTNGKIIVIFSREKRMTIRQVFMRMREQNTDD